MFAAVISMLSGLYVSLYGLGTQNASTVLAGLIIIGTVFVSWWFWIMLIIRSMISNADRTIADIKADLQEVKSLIQQNYISSGQR
jgi:Zn-dependent protease with chaperone function